MALTYKNIDFSKAVLKYAKIDSNGYITQNIWRLFGPNDIPAITDGNANFGMVRTVKDGDDIWQIIEHTYWYGGQWFIKNGELIWFLGQDYYTRNIILRKYKLVLQFGRSDTVRVYDFNGNKLYEGSYSNIFESDKLAFGYTALALISHAYTDYDNQYLSAGVWLEWNDDQSDKVGKAGIMVFKMEYDPQQYPDTAGLKLKQILANDSWTGISYTWYGGSTAIPEHDTEDNLITYNQCYNAAGSSPGWIRWKEMTNDGDIIIDSSLLDNTSIFGDVNTHPRFFTFYGYGIATNPDIDRSLPAYFGNGWWLYMDTQRNIGLLYDRLNDRLIRSFKFIYPMYDYDKQLIPCQNSYYDVFFSYYDIETDTLSIGSNADAGREKRCFITKYRAKSEAIFENITDLTEHNGANIKNVIIEYESYMPKWEPTVKFYIKKSTDTQWTMIDNSTDINLNLLSGETFDLRILLYDLEDEDYDLENNLGIKTIRIYYEAISDTPMKPELLFPKNGKFFHKGNNRVNIGLRTSSFPQFFDIYIDGQYSETKYSATGGDIVLYGVYIPDGEHTLEIIPKTLDGIEGEPL